jgi:hypothetical protein
MRPDAAEVISFLTYQGVSLGAHCPFSCGATFHGSNSFVKKPNVFVKKPNAALQLLPKAEA